MSEQEATADPIEVETETTPVEQNPVRRNTPGQTIVDPGQDINVRSRRSIQNFLQQQDMQDMNPLLMIFLLIFSGGDLGDLFEQQAQERATDYNQNPGSYGTVTRRVEPSDPSGQPTFAPVENFPNEVTFTKAYQEEGSLNRIYEGTDSNGESVTIIKARDTSREGTRSWANNNPGNLRYSQWEDEYGAIGQDEDGFAIFESVEAGLEAQKHLLQSENYANLTLREAVYRYAPQHENDSEAYARQVSQATGIATNRVLNTLSEDEQNKLVRAMVNHEGWREARVLTQNSDGTTSPTTPQGNTDVASSYTGGSGLFVQKPMGDGQIITSDFGPRNLAMSNMHRGIDLRTRHLDPAGNVELYARQPMVITDISENRGGYGYRVSAVLGKDDEGRAITVQYSHLDSLPRHIREGDTLEAGDYIATTGSSGRGTGAHLDFEVRIGSQVVDPEKAFTTDLSNSNNGDQLIAEARNTLGSKAHSGTYAAHIEPALNRYASAVNSLEATRAANPRLATFNDGGVSEITLASNTVPNPEDLGMSDPTLGTNTPAV